MPAPCYRFSTNGGTHYASERLRLTAANVRSTSKGPKSMESYGIIGWIVIGGIAGAIAKMLMPGRDPGGCIITILLGVAGALVA